jgi:predicted nucleic acid-binding protein
VAGRVVDLSDPTTLLPEFIVIDSNINIERVAAAFGFQSSRINGPRAEQFFQRLSRDDAIGIVTPAVYAELLHVLVKFRYRSELIRNRPVLTQQFGPLSSWVDLYKRDPSILQGMRGDLERLAAVLLASGIHVLSTDELTLLAWSHSSEEELIDTMCRYGLDSTDAIILIEAQRIPTLDIATSDADMLRAQADFTIYTWL